MIWLLLAFTLLASAASAATRYVCNSLSDDVCNGQTFAYTTTQAAWDASKAAWVAGDHTPEIIVMKAGQDHPVVNIRGRESVTFRSSQYLSNRAAFRDGYRVARDFSGAASPLARILAPTTTAPVTIGETFTTGTRSGTDLNVVDVSQIAVGDKLVLQGTYLGVFYCEDVDVPSTWLKCATGDNAATYITGKGDGKGVFGWNGNSGMQDGDIVYPIFQVAPTYNGGTPLLTTTPLYVVEFLDGGAAGVSSASPDLWRLSLTAGGTAIDFDPWPIYPANVPTGLNLVHAIWPLRQDEAAYVTVKAGNILTLSLTPGGSAIPLVGRGTRYNSATDRPSGVDVFFVKPVRNITFEGIEITESPTAALFPLVNVIAQGVIEAITENITFKHCWIHGDYNWTYGPTVGILSSMTGLKVHDSIIDNITATGADTQGIGGTSGGGNWDIKNNELAATGETIMTGGSMPAILGNVPTNILVTNNYFNKPRQWWQSTGAVLIGTTGFRLKRSGSALANCSLETNSWEMCTWHTPSGVRYDILQDLVFTVGTFPGSSGTIYLKGDDSGNLIIEGPTGTVWSACPTWSGHTVTCTAVASPSFGSSRTYTAIVSGVITTTALTSVSQMRWTTKNHFETKSMTFFTLRGNFFNFQFADDQNAALVLNTTASASETSGIDYFARNGDALIEYNLFRHVVAAIVFSGRSYGVYSPPRDETSGFGDSGKFVIRNNLFTGIGGQDLYKSSHKEGVLIPTNETNNIIFDHNTAVDISLAAHFAGSLAAPTVHVITKNNIFVPWNRTIGTRTGWRATAPDVTGTSGLSWRHSAYSFNFMDASSRFINNVMMNWNNVLNGSLYTTSIKKSTNPAIDTNTSLFSTDATWHYTYTTFLGDPAAFTTLQRTPSSLFTAWTEENYAISNYRVKDTFPNGIGTPVAVETILPSSDGKRIGADIDELEAWTGPNGADVIAGIPRFAERSHRLLAPATSTAVISYIPNGSSCTIKVWPNANYVGTPSDDTNDIGGFTSQGRMQINLIGFTTGTQYYGKRWCGTAVDVFSFKTL